MNEIAEIKLSYSTQGGNKDKFKVSSNEVAYNYFKDNWDTSTLEMQEECKALLLNRSNCVLGIYSLSRGGISGTVVDIKLLLVAAIKACASSIILAHNHPSGNLKPSHQDIKLTQKLIKACEYLDIQFLDHLIITKENFASIKDAV
ncbi:JAB domain-containing protein [Nonlabens xiamenensis]|uniref:JAB domain-containing protein n=1 Tax=Nonlabens xiamenensis TaxID=2341043 RepID=UPI000F60EA9A|nr:JAB domain-containing protein [Nonlabens xiamenensis]